MLCWNACNKVISEVSMHSEVPKIEPRLYGCRLHQLTIVILSCNSAVVNKVCKTGL